MNIDATTLHLQLPNLYLFRRVTQLGSFQATADALQLPRSSVSKKIAQLEQHLGLRLLQRSTRQLNLTDAGKELLIITDSLTDLLSNTAKLTEQAQAKPSGRVKISSSTLIGQRYLLPLLPDLKRLFPEIVIDINLDDRVVDLIELGIDIALRVGQLPDSSLVARQIGIKSWACFASPAYLQDAAKLDKPSDLSAHQCIIFRHQKLAMDHWHFCSPSGEIQTIHITPATASDDGRTLVELACMGMGIIRVDPILIKPELQAGKLTAVLTAWHHPDAAPIHLVCLEKEARSRAVNEVWQYLSKELTHVLKDAGEN
ncbi:LysR family transcriptional regulator [Pseudoalteromonas tunicata]|uniref:LysR family transcriptional regulator n=1 Tax=Pseudoalteromonas tunicata TaxID=314281 RepID=UPI00273F44FB|nr:LysR family transcriptional regulator [Pseudoalteromonas tunicata]MDP4982578.1 LysR family transcriptional regulator [Pseudoalteromonas tunicata]